MAEKLTEAISVFETDDSANIGILYGIGGNFSAGLDLDELSVEIKDASKFLTDEGWAVCS